MKTLLVVVIIIAMYTLSYLSFYNEWERRDLGSGASLGPDIWQGYV